MLDSGEQRPTVHDLIGRPDGDVISALRQVESCGGVNGRVGPQVR